MTLKNPVVALALALLLVPACNAINPDLLSAGPKDAPESPKDAAPDGAVDLPEPGMILRYAFEDSGTVVRDISGRHKDGTASVASVWTAQGRLGRGLALTGTQYVSLPDGVLEGVDDFTIATWVKVATNADWARIYDFGNAAGNQWMFLTLSGYVPLVTPPVNDGVHSSSYGGNQTSENWFGTSTKLPTSVWKHVAVTGSGVARRLYIDGFPAGSNSGPIVPPRQMEPMGQNSWLGRSHFEAPPGNDPRLNATLDDFRIYDHVLSPHDIQQLAWPGHDYSYWRFDEPSGTSAQDSSDNAVAATLTSDVTWTTGLIGGAVKLPGGPPGVTGPHLSIGTSPLATCTEFTAAVWVKLDAIDTSRIFDFGTGAASYIYLAVSDGTGLHFGMAAPGKAPFDLQTTSQPLSAGDGMWHHVAVTVLAGAANVYVDGALLAANRTGTPLKASDVGATTQNWIGQSRVSGDRYLSGSLDELRIACRAYTPDEITNLSRPVR